MTTSKLSLPMYVPHVFQCPTCLVHNMLLCLTCLNPYKLSSSTSLVLFVFLCLTCFRALQVLVPQMSCASGAFVPHVPCALSAIVSNVSYTPRALRASYFTCSCAIRTSFPACFHVSHTLCFTCLVLYVSCCPPVPTAFPVSHVPSVLCALMIYEPFFLTYLQCLEP